MRRAAVCLSLFFLLVPTILPAAPPALGPGEELTLERCIEIGIANQPEILQYLYTLEASQADLGKAKASYYPRLDVKGTLTGYNLARKTDDPYPPINLYGYRYLDNTLSLSQKIYDFGGGRPRWSSPVIASTRPVWRWRIGSTTSSTVSRGPITRS